MKNNEKKVKERRVVGRNKGRGERKGQKIKGRTGETLQKEEDRNRRRNSVVKENKESGDNEKKKRRGG